MVRLEPAVDMSKRGIKNSIEKIDREHQLKMQTFPKCKNKKCARTFNNNNC